MQVDSTIHSTSPATSAPPATDDYTTSTTGQAVPAVPTGHRLATVVGWQGGSPTTLSFYRLEPDRDTPSNSRWLLEETVTLDGTFGSYEFSGFGSRVLAVFDTAPTVVTYRFEAV